MIEGSIDLLWLLHGKLCITQCAIVERIERLTYHTFEQLDLLQSAQMHVNGDLGLQLFGQHTEHALFVQVLFVLPLIIEPFDNAIFQGL